MSEEWVVNPSNKGVRNTFRLDHRRRRLEAGDPPVAGGVKEKTVTVDQPCARSCRTAWRFATGRRSTSRTRRTIAHNVNYAGRKGEEPRQEPDRSPRRDDPRDRPEGRQAAGVALLQHPRLMKAGRGCSTIRTTR